MTREEASSVLDDYDVNFDGHTAEEIAEAFDVAFWALEQEPTTKNDLGVDCISRQAVERLVWEYLRKPTEENVAFYEHFLELPSVTPRKPRTGHWEVVSDGYSDNAYICECSECKDTVWVYKDTDRKWNYCPNCGADMREVQEDDR